MSALNLKELDPACTSCIRGYKRKHRGGEASKQFLIPCTGIPKEYDKFHLPVLTSDALSAASLLDPVTWAAEVLDWHCLDPDGAVWKRKTEQGKALFPFLAHDSLHIERALGGKSPYHRPYQATILRCSSPRKVLRIGRQCIEESEFVYTKNGIVLVKDLINGTEILGGVCSGVHSFEDEIIRVCFSNGTKLKVNGEHPFFTQRGWVEARALTLNDWVEFIKPEETENPFLFNGALKEFVSKYFNGDGYIWSYKRPTRSGYRLEIGFAIGGSRRKAYEFQWILWRLGIGSVVKKEWMLKSTQYFYRVLVSRAADMKILLSFLDKTKYPDKFSLFEQRLLSRKGDSTSVRTTDTGQFARVKKLERIGKGTVVGWETDSHEIIGYGGMRTHNSGKSEVLCIDILHNIFTKDRFKVVIIAPYQTQIELLFQRLDNLIKDSQSLANSIKRYVKAPNYTIELYNGSFVRGFTAATRSGGNADAVRGQTADKLLFDEADLLAPGDIASALNVITNQSNATLLMSSTPTGKRESFWNNCNSPNWKEFHFPSSVNPNWDHEKERQFREELGSRYIHECDAEFGNQLEGVFQASFVEAAKADYEYSHMSRQPGWFYCIGVDWNDVRNGTAMRVVGFNPADNLFYVVDKRNVSREGWNQLAACEEIANINKAWQPEWIYVDRGYGNTSIEVLHKYGWDALADPKRGSGHPDSRLARIVIAYDSGSKVEVHDPFTKQPIAKHAKPFLVENAVRRFERGQLKFPQSDKTLEAELLGYVVDRVTQYGQPVYVQGNEKLGDHNLDALNLALVAFTLKMSDFGKPRYETTIAFSGKFGQTSEADKIKELNPALIIPADPKRAIQEQKDIRKPATNRASVMEKEQEISSILTTKNKIPAVLSKERPKKLWAWPGWERDQPAPIRKSLTGREPPRRRIP